ncbi:xanthine dehydrogenase accessory factor [Dethiosulfatibacter aminovorans DSM 17477]|uniref:Xanthine dehydrogenase accessory factor n=1 Tax=Dethiosulfatibacter aminovorans DSM 17477 TaxID=1121476 RepID=A0A1M6LJZ6_9FIRM|nr:selenium-dependent molybdenum cofactor biosynthesis protein YqeB [Dethiosulfatibacter aminovorans]SHJ71458.1 xanthine dehydrogenase accessory factor [Dethiosulfatibacter aminovorans DSM 17477]
MYREIVIVRSGGDVASGTIKRLHEAGFKVIVLEIENPTAIRRTVSYSQCVFDGTVTIEGTTARLCRTLEEVDDAHFKGEIPVVIDPKGEMIDIIQPQVLIDAILAKKNLGTDKSMADIVIALGPGFEAGVDVDAVIETNRGHNLGRVIYEGKPQANTGAPGNIGGYTVERVIYSSGNGEIKVFCDIGSLVEKDEVIAEVEGKEIRSKIKGVIRGMIADKTHVFKGMKIGDVDPRNEVKNCYGISDKARAVGGGVLEAILHLQMKDKE